VTTVVVSSSGSSGSPTPILRPLQTWVESAQAEAATFNILPSDRFAVLGSPQHSLWAYAKFRSERLGGPFWGLQTLNRSGLKEFKEFLPTVVYAIPELLCTLAKSLPSIDSVRLVISGGGAWSAQTTEAVRQAFPKAQVRLFYGTVECSFIAHSTPQLSPWYQPFIGVAVELRENREIWVNSPFTVRPQCWTPTGDAGAIEEGRLRIVGRLYRRIRWRGRDVIPELMEQEIQMRWPDVRVLIAPSGRHASGRLSLTAFCVGIAKSDDQIAQMGRAIREIFKPQPTPEQYVWLPEWPMLTSGKPDMHALSRLSEQLNDD